MKVFSIVLAAIIIVCLTIFIVVQTIGLIKQIKAYRKKKKEIKIVEKKEE